MAASSILICLLLTIASCTHPQLVDYRFDSSYSVSDPQFARSVTSLFGPPLVPGNSIDTLLNGVQVFPAMLEAINAAKYNVNFETYTWWDGQVAHEFAQAFAEKAKAGITVRVQLDAFGSMKIKRAEIALMENAGVKVQLYHVFNFFDLRTWRQVDHRTHRKLLIIDGNIAFIGGVGHADMWLGNAQDKDHWRDNHYRLRGPIVAHVQGVFADNWMKSTGEVLDGPQFFPPLEPAGSQHAQVFKTSPQNGSETMQLLILFSIAHARKNIRIESAYFVPDDLTRQTLVNAAKRGVKIQIIVPGRNIDEKIVRAASRAHWGEMLKSGIEILEYQPSMIHAKLLVVDDFWTSIGSANMDNRSFRINDEANLNVLDSNFADTQIKCFNDDLAHSQRITYEQWRHRSLLERLTELFADSIHHEL